MQRPHSEAPTYLAVYGILLLLVALTVAISRFELGEWGLLTSLSIAAAKAALIILVFMHIQKSTPLVKLIAGAGLLWLGLMFSLSLTDYLARNWDVLIGASNANF